MSTQNSEPRLALQQSNPRVSSHPNCRPTPNRGPKAARSRRLFRRRGAATIEMALVAPFVILIVFGSIEFSRIVMIKQSLTNSAREGCRQATLATTLDYATAEAYARERMKGIVKNYTNADVLRISISPEFSTTTVENTDTSTEFVSIGVVSTTSGETMTTGETTQIESVASGGFITTSIEVDCADVSWLPPMFFAGAVIRASATMNKE